MAQSLALNRRKQGQEALVSFRARQHVLSGDARLPWPNTALGWCTT